MIWQIFFPRSAENEYAVKQASLQRNSRHTRTMQSQGLRTEHTMQSPTGRSPTAYTSDFPPPSILEHDGDERYVVTTSPTSIDKQPLDIEGYVPPVTTYFSPNRRLPSGATLQGAVSVMTAQNLARHNNVNPLITNFRSPIGVLSSC